MVRHAEPRRAAGAHVKHRQRIDAVHPVLVADVTAVGDEHLEAFVRLLVPVGLARHRHAVGNVGEPDRPRRQRGADFVARGGVRVVAVLVREDAARGIDLRDARCGTSNRRRHRPRTGRAPRRCRCRESPGRGWPARRALRSAAGLAARGEADRRGAARHADDDVGRRRAHAAGVDRPHPHVVRAVGHRRPQAGSAQRHDGEIGDPWRRTGLEHVARGAGRRLPADRDVVAGDLRRQSGWRRGRGHAPDLHDDLIRRRADACRGRGPHAHEILAVWHARRNQAR